MPLRSIFLMTLARVSQTIMADHVILVPTMMIRQINPEHQQLRVGNACFGFGYGFKFSAGFVCKSRRFVFVIRASGG